MYGIRVAATTALALTLALTPAAAGITPADGVRGPAEDIVCEDAASPVPGVCEAWTARHDGPAGGIDLAAALLLDRDRVVLVGGNDGNPHVVVLAAETGELLLQRVIDLSAHGTPQLEGVRDAALYPDGSAVVVVAEVWAGDDRGSDVVTVAVDLATGATMWQTVFDGGSPFIDRPAAVEVTPDGDLVLVALHSENPGEQRHTDLVLLAYDAGDGRARWSDRYDGPASSWDLASDLVLSPDGTRAFFAGDVTGPGGWYDMAVLAYDVATGERLWVTLHDGLKGVIDQVRALATSPDGSAVYATGEARNFGPDGLFCCPSDLETIALDAATGDLLWLHRLDGGGADRVDAAAAIDVDPHTGAIAVGGHAGDRDVVALLDPETGQQRWVARYAHREGRASSIVDVAFSPDGAVVHAAGTGWVTAISAVISLHAIDSADGAISWNARYASPGQPHTEAVRLGVTPDGSLVVVGGNAGGTYRPLDLLAVAFPTEGPTVP